MGCVPEIIEQICRAGGWRPQKKPKGLRLAEKYLKKEERQKGGDNRP
jgi:hypothetical protein